MGVNVVGTCADEARGTWATAARRLLAGGSLAVIARSLDPGVSMHLDAIPCHGLPRIRYRGPLHGVGSAISKGLAGSGAVAAWLAEDACRLAALYAGLAGARDVSLRLEGVHGDSCRIVHVDAVRLRLVTTYVGPGTEYLSPGGAEGRLIRLPTGHVAVFRGSKDLPAGVDGLPHRSPPLEGTGLHRLFLAIDEGA